MEAAVTKVPRNVESFLQEKFEPDSVKVVLKDVFDNQNLRRAVADAKADLDESTKSNILYTKLSRADGPLKHGSSKRELKISKCGNSQGIFQVTLSKSEGERGDSIDPLLKKHILIVAGLDNLEGFMVHKVKSLKFESFIHTPFRATANSIEPPQKKVSIKRIFKGCSNKSKYKLTSEFKETPEKPEYMSEMLFNKVKSCKDSLVMIRACSAVELERFSTDEDESEESENSDEYEEYDEAGESEIEDLEYQTRDRKSKTVEDMEEHTFHIRNFLQREKIHIQQGKHIEN